MKHCLALLAGLLISAPLCAIEQVGKTITLDDEEHAICRRVGCVFISVPALDKMLATACQPKT